jgi:2-dehydro-3-deoxyphosphogluconate aldolase / (4S)-4-hydroxy-2-oxoglutarate aldolase
MNFSKSILSRLAELKVVAVFSVRTAEQAVSVAKALHEGGIKAIELTLRTAAGIDAVGVIGQQVPDMLLGVGTILTPEQAIAVKQAGAHFGLAPGMNPEVVRAAISVNLPFAPGVATPSDLEAAIALGCRLVKLFPAAALGGVPYLKSMATPYRHLGVQYIPLGGVNSENLADYLAVPDVLCAGGSWIVKDDLVEAEDWNSITERAAQVVAAINQGGACL